MGTKFITCLVCFEKSRRRSGWWCEHCGHMEPPEIRAQDVTSIPKPKHRPMPTVLSSKPMTELGAKTLAKAQRRLEQDQLANDIARMDRSKLPKLTLRPKAGLRRG